MNTKCRKYLQVCIHFVVLVHPPLKSCNRSSKKFDILVTDSLNRIRNRKSYLNRCLSSDTAVQLLCVQLINYLFMQFSAVERQQKCTYNCSCCCQAAIKTFSICNFRHSQTINISFACETRLMAKFTPTDIPIVSAYTFNVILHVPISNYANPPPMSMSRMSCPC